MEVSPELTTVFAGTVTSTYYNIALQIFCKLVTFALNGLILRYISKDLLGVINVRLLLLHTTILFLCREGIRRACSGNLQPSDWKKSINLIWLGIVLSLPIAFLLSLIWLFAMEVPNDSYYAVGVWAYALSSIIELLAEPFYITAQEMMILKLRVYAKFFSLAIQAALNAVFIIGVPRFGILIFAGTQVLGAVVYTGCFCLYFWKKLQQLKAPTSNSNELPVYSIRDFLPVLAEGPLLPDRLRHLAWSFTKQSFMKQILTEGERYIMSGLQMLTFAEQGIYDVINNLGSLVARLLFQQVEENAYVLFSKVLPRERDQSSPTKKNDSEAFGAKMLEVYLKTITAFSIIIVIFGYSYSDILLQIYGGQVLTTGDAPALMRAFWVYVLFLAVNGVTEAFVFSAMSKAEVDSYNRKLVGFSLSFLVSSWGFVKWLGAVGFIVANSLNMALRIAHSVIFIHRYYQHSRHDPLRGILVNRVFFIGCLAVAAVLPVLRSACDLTTVLGNVVFLAVGAGLGVALLCVLWRTERELIFFLTNLFRRREVKLE
ncbi:Protein RFT1-like protein [Hypsibius exemplaris]|uniref:Protein RFT1 homolog n=1 Tax=Hypsibius exemplaris TaxID=2072580 RepID=A0A1W0X899_HYPEX|nr:Protein RFT1-like protein [Hypsibius exemplaris]